MKKLSILGSTGSIGTQALDVCRQNGYSVAALAAGSNTKLLEQQVRKFSVPVAAVYDEAAYRDLKQRLADTSVKVLAGEQGVCEAAAQDECDTVLNAIVGIAGLRPTMTAISAGKTLALANKESLVTGGNLVMQAAKERGVSILPVDSEHSAIFQCLEGNNNSDEIFKIILTASGGPFFGKTKEELYKVTKEQALKHPNWDMGAKITIDSATMMNKGLEIIEAAWLFRVNTDQIEVVVHRESVIHSAVEFVDGSVIAQLGVPDMRLPIQYALTYPNRVKGPSHRLSLTQYGTLTFFEPDYETFRCLGAAKEALAMGGLAPCVVNGANEQAVALFLDGKIRFIDIGELVCSALHHIKVGSASSIEDVFAADKAAREYVLGQYASVRS